MVYKFFDKKASSCASKEEIIQNEELLKASIKKFEKRKV